MKRRPGPQSALNWFASDTESHDAVRSAALTAAGTAEGSQRYAVAAGVDAAGDCFGLVGGMGVEVRVH